METKTNALLTITLLISIILMYPVFEAGVLKAATSQTVVVRQQVTGEISLTVNDNSIDMSPAIAGLTGGTGNGSVNLNIITNNSAGYSVTLQASGTAAAMNGETQGGIIPDYDATTPEAWDDNSAGQPAQFGFAIDNTSLSAANTASGYTTCETGNANDCFSKAPTTTAKTIATVGEPTAAAGDTIALLFRVHVPANSNPIVIEDWYAATTTITAVMQ